MVNGLMPGCGLLHLLDHQVEVYGTRLLARRILLERLKKTLGTAHGRDVEEHVLESPIIVRVGGDVGPLIGVGA